MPSICTSTDMIHSSKTRWASELLLESLLKDELIPQMIWSQTEILFQSWQKTPLPCMRAMNMKNQPIVTYEAIEFEK